MSQNIRKTSKVVALYAVMNVILIITQITLAVIVPFVPGKYRFIRYGCTVGFLLFELGLFSFGILVGMAFK